MPSGAKKRKAARRKKEVEEVEQGLFQSQDSAAPDASTENSHDGKQNTSSSSSDGEKQDESKESFVAPIEVEAITIVDEKEIAVSTAAETVSVEEVVQSTKSYVGMEDSASPAVTELSPMDAPIFVGEETIEAAEVTSDTLESTLEIDPLRHKVEAKAASISEETPVAIQLPHDSGEPRRDTEIPETTPVPLAAHRTSWWNCCGLFDALTDSKDNIRG